MRRFLSILLIFGLVNYFVLFNFPQKAEATTTWVQGPAAQSTAGASTVSQAFVSSTPAGNLVVVSISQQNGPGIKAITRVYDSVDGIGSVYSLGESRVGAASRVDMYYKVAAGAGTRTVTVDFTGGTTDSTIGINEFNSTYTVLDAHSDNAGTASPATPGSVNPAGNALYVAAYVDENGQGQTGPGGAWTIRQQVDSSAISSFLVLEQTTSGAQNPSVSYGGAPGAWQAISVTFIAGTPISQTAYRFRNDDGSEATATWLAAENTNITQPTMTNTRLRIQASTTGDTAAALYQLEFKKSTDSVYKKVGTTTSAIAFVATSTAVVGSTALTQTYPLGIQSGDLLVLGVESKPGTATIVTPAGWTVSPTANPIGGSGANGVDTGTTTTKIFVREADSTDTGTFAVTITTGNSSIGQMAAYRRGTGQNWATSTVGAVDNVPNTNWSAATTTLLGLQSGDVIVTASGINTDASDFNAPAITATGITFGTEAKIASSTTTTGNDTGLFMTHHFVTAGTDSSGPTLTMTASGQAANRPAGGTVFIRLRQIDDPIHLKTTANITDTGEDTTAQLSVPGGKSFTAGRINDTENPADSVDIATDRYSEFEWNLNATTTASNGDIYQFRLTTNGSVLTTYTVTPQWTIGTVAPASTLFGPPVVQVKNQIQIRRGNTYISQ